MCWDVGVASTSKIWRPPSRSPQGRSFGVFSAPPLEGEILDYLAHGPIIQALTVLE